MPDRMKVLVTGSSGLIGGVVVRALQEKYDFYGLDRVRLRGDPDIPISIADIYEYELPWVEVGQRAVVELSYLPGERFEGEVTYVYPFLDPKTRTARVRIELPNPDGTLKPDMFANVTIESAVHPDVVAVPEEAVIRSGRRSLVILAVGEGIFEPRDVEIGLDSGDGWLEVTAGLDAGEQVVVSSQFLIDSESRLQEAVQKLLGARSTGSMDDEASALSEHEGHPGPDRPIEPGGR